MVVPDAVATKPPQYCFVDSPAWLAVNLSASILLFDLAILVPVALQTKPPTQALPSKAVSVTEDPSIAPVSTSPTKPPADEDDIFADTTLQFLIVSSWVVVCGFASPTIPPATSVLLKGEEMFPINVRPVRFPVVLLTIPPTSPLTDETNIVTLDDDELILCVLLPTSPPTRQRPREVQFMDPLAVRLAREDDAEAHKAPRLTVECAFTAIWPENVTSLRFAQVIARPPISTAVRPVLTETVPFTVTLVNTPPLSSGVMPATFVMVLEEKLVANSMTRLEILALAPIDLNSAATVSFS